MASTSGKKSAPNLSKYVYDLPYIERKTLCRILDLNDAWEELGGAQLGFDVNDLYRFKQAVMRNASPTDEMLRAWGIQNHTVLELYVHLSYMHHYQAMSVLKPFVPSEYHILINRGEENPLRLANLNLDENVAKCSGFDPFKKNLEFGAHNIDQHNKVASAEPSNDTKKILNSSANSSDHLKNVEKDPLKEALEGHIPLISYAELEEATGYWNSKNLLGKGGFGTVFKGVWKCTDVAIKRLEVQPSKVADDKSKYQSQLFTELRSLNTFRHDNILPLYGFSVGGSHDCLIYQYMPNGSLEDKLLCRDHTWPLSWSIRHNIAIGIARGLQFLHTFGDKPLVHGDIKSANILLDPSFVPKIGDFGLAKEGPLENYTYIKVSRVHGTKPYLPDEFLRDRKFSTKVDVYSYGIVLFELASGLRAYDDKRKNRFLKDHVESVSDDKIAVLCDPRIAPDDKISFSAFITLGKQCTDIKSKNRPEMVVVLKDLEYFLCSDEINYRLPNLVVNSARPSIQNDLPNIYIARDRQVTASVPPPLPKPNSPISPIPHIFLNGNFVSPSPPLKSDTPQQPTEDRSVGDSSSSNSSISEFSESSPQNGHHSIDANNIVEHRSSSESSMIPALSVLLQKD